MEIFKNITSLAKKRFVNDSKNSLPASDVHLMKLYMEQLINDLENLKEFEKSKSWADGARMLLHELKNPMTPLKLSVQQLQIDDNLCGKEEIKRIVSSLSDIEKILGYFKELVTIEFGQKEQFDLKTFLEDVITDCTSSYGDFLCKNLDSLSEFQIISEQILFKMLFVNLVKNGMEANPGGFFVEIQEKENRIDILFITEDRTLQDISNLYKLGYSPKGSIRGFGLFLCKKISDYLDLNLHLLNDSQSVIFSISLNKQFINVKHDKSDFQGEVVL